MAASVLFSQGQGQAASDRKVVNQVYMVSSMDGQYDIKDFAILSEIRLKQA